MVSMQDKFHSDVGRLREGVTVDQISRGLQETVKGMLRKPMLVASPRDLTRI